MEAGRSPERLPGWGGPHYVSCPGVCPAPESGTNGPERAGASTEPESLNAFQSSDYLLGRKAVPGWLEQSGLGYDHLKDAPEMYEYAVAIKRDNIAVLWHRSDGVVELQCTPTFNDDITKDFFARHAASGDSTASKLRCSAWR